MTAEGDGQRVWAPGERVIRMEESIRAVLLEATHGNTTRVAAQLGIARGKLHTRLKRFGLIPESPV